jgi:hypothetical protein
VLGVSETHRDNSNRGPDGVQKRAVVDVAAVTRHDEDVGGEVGSRRDLGQFSCVDIAGDQRREAWQY